MNAIDILDTIAARASDHATRWRNGREIRLRCVAHGGRTPTTLRLKAADDGGIIPKCYKGCEPRDIRAALLGAYGVDIRGEARPRSAAPPPPVAREAGPAPRPLLPALDSQPPARMLAEHGQRLAATGPASVYCYRDAEDATVLALARWPTKGGKEPRPFHFDGRRWRIGLGGPVSALPLYRLPELLAQPEALVLVCEGEKTADLLAAHAHLSTSAYGGSHPHRATDWTPLTGRDVLIAPDYDHAGRQHLGLVGAALEGLAGRIRWIPPARLYAALGGQGRPPVGWDYADGGNARPCVDCGRKVQSAGAGRCRSCAEDKLNALTG